MLNPDQNTFKKCFLNVNISSEVYTQNLLVSGNVSSCSEIKSSYLKPEIFSSFPSFWEVTFGPPRSRSRSTEPTKSVLRIRIRIFFWPPGSKSSNMRYGSGSFYHQAKMIRKKRRFRLFCDFFMNFF